MSVSTSTLTHEQIFVQFLKHYRVFSAFKRNHSFEFNSHLNSVSVKTAIHKAFPWTEASHSYSFWLDLHYKWENLCRQFNLRGTLNYETVLRTR